MRKNNEVTRSSTEFFSEHNVRERLMRSNRGVLNLLNFLASRHKVPMNGQSRGAFEEWLTKAHKYIEDRPASIPRYGKKFIMNILFPQ